MRRNSRPMLKAATDICRAPKALDTASWPPGARMTPWVGSVGVTWQTSPGCVAARGSRGAARAAATAGAGAVAAAQGMRMKPKSLLALSWLTPATTPWSLMLVGRTIGMLGTWNDTVVPSALRT